MTKEKKQQTERKMGSVPTSFYFRKDLKKALAKHVFEKNQESKTTSQEQFINEAVEEKLKKLKLL